MYAAAAAGLGVVVLLLVLVYRWKKTPCKSAADCSPCTLGGTQLVHRLCPHHNVVQCFEVEQKDSLDDHLDVLTRKLAEKEGRLRLSKSKIRETQHEIDNLHAIDQNVRFKYREIMDSLKTDLLSNEKECKRLQEQIEWVSRRRAELKDEVQRKEAAYRREAKKLEKCLLADLNNSDTSETVKVRRGQRLYGEAAAELATNLAELQRGRVIDKPHQHSMTSLRHRKEPQLPRATIACPFKTQQPSSPPPASRYVMNESL